ncbi:MAG: hypothetical protein AAGJ82_09130 [Bacteroidota bacterium]
MQDSKLLKGLRNLTAKQRQRFKVYVNSAYFNQHKLSIKLLNYIYKHIDKRPQKLARELVFAVLFPGEAYEEQALFNQMSALKKLFHRFLAQQQYEAQHFQEDTFLLKASLDNNQYELLTNRAKQIRKKLDAYPFRDTDQHAASYSYSSTMMSYHANHGDRSKPTVFQELSTQLDRYYILEKLRHSCTLTANQILINSRYDLGLLEDVLRYVETHIDDLQEDGEHSILLHYTILMSMRDSENPAHYQLLKSMLRDKIHCFNNADKGTLYLAANNYCVRQINNGYSEFRKELFDLYKEGLRTELILQNGVLNEWSYKNITALGCSLSDWEWTEQFLEDYREKLPKHTQENSYNYNMAHLNIKKKRYDVARDHLLQVRFSDVKYHLNYNILLMSTYYALDDMEALLSLIDTFRIYVMRSKKITVDQKRQYTNFLRFARKLTLIKQTPRAYGEDPKEIKFAQLYLQIRDSKNIVNRYWLESTCQQEAGNYLDEVLAKAEAQAEAQ